MIYTALIIFIGGLFTGAWLAIWATVDIERRRQELEQRMREEKE